MVVVIGCTPTAVNATVVGISASAANCCQNVVRWRTITTGMPPTASTTSTTIAKIINCNKSYCSSSSTGSNNTGNISLNWPKKYIRQRQEYKIHNNKSATFLHTIRSSSIVTLTSIREVSTISSSAEAVISFLSTESETFNTISPEVIEEEEEDESSDDTTTKNKIAPCGKIIPLRNTDINIRNECTTTIQKEPQYSVRRRVLVTSDSDDGTNNNTNTNTSNKKDINFIMIKLNSLNGKKMLIDSLVNNTCKSYISLIEHYTNQNEPSYCGLTTFIIVCNALTIDPTVVRWKGIWRYFANETILFHLHPCLHKLYIHSIGINLDQFYNLSICQGLYCIMKRPINTSSSISSNCSNPGSTGTSNPGSGDSGITNNTTNYVASTTTCTTSSSQTQQQQQQQQQHEEEEQEEIEQLYSIEEFRSDIRKALCENYDTDNDTIGSTSSTTNTKTNTNNTIDEIIVVSFNRKSLYQTGDGHFSPIGGYHESTDTVLILDVARFKYQPYWVSIVSLYNSMIPIDTTTNRSRGWFILSSSSSSSSSSSTNNNKTTTSATYNSKTTTNINNTKHTNNTTTNNKSQSTAATAVNHIHTTATNTTTPTERTTTTTTKCDEIRMNTCSTTNNNKNYNNNNNNNNIGSTKDGCIGTSTSTSTSATCSSFGGGDGGNILNSWNTFVQSEDCIPIQFVPLAEKNYCNPCPIFTIKGMYCPNNNIK